VGIILTDLEIEPDPIYNGPQLCNKCMACVKACPGGCIPADKTVKVNLAGNELEWADVDMAGCSTSFVGSKKTEQEVPAGEEYREDDKKSTPGEWSPFYKKPHNLYNTGQAVCGARGCTRACMISLESRGVLKNAFKEKFRRRKPWTVDWNTEPEYPNGANFRGQIKNEAD
jgi:ferredoxin